MAKQVDEVLNYIKTFGSITALDAMRDLGVMRLASRISDLKKMGYHIVGANVPVTNRFGKVCYVKSYELKNN